MKRKKVPDRLECPCCGERPFVDPQKMPLSLEQEMNRRDPKNRWRGDIGWSVGLARHSLLEWACDECLAARRALKAKPWLQFFCCDTPLFAYRDEERTCRTCGAEFLFSAREKRRWYEEYKFLLDSVPVHCLPCRRARRVHREANSSLALALKDLDPKDVAQLVAVSELYLQVGSTKKAVEFLRRAKNQSRDPKQVGELVSRIRNTEQTEPESCA